MQLETGTRVCAVSLDENVNGGCCVLVGERAPPLAVIASKGASCLGQCECGSEFPVPVALEYPQYLCMLATQNPACKAKHPTFISFSYFSLPSSLEESFIIIIIFKHGLCEHT